MGKKFEYNSAPGKRQSPVKYSNHEMQLVTYDSMGDLFSELIETDLKIKDLPEYQKLYEGNISADQKSEWEKKVWDLPRFQKAISEITKPDPKLAAEIQSQAELWAELAIEEEPILTLGNQWEPSEEGEDWDAGKIAMGHENPCFDQVENSEVIPGKAGGAYRIIISTDVSWDCSPRDAASAIGAMCLVLQERAPIEIWVQQGWWGSGSSYDGVTLFPVSKGTDVDPGHLAFWCGSPLKDRVFSYWISRQLGRVGSRTVVKPALDTNLFMDSIGLPYGAPEEAKVKWVKDTICGILYQCSVEEYKEGVSVEKVDQKDLNLNGLEAA